MTTLELTVAAPRLQAYGKDWTLAVPGSYKPQRPLVRLAGIKNCLMLMTSKQHPRKLSVIGNYMGKFYCLNCWKAASHCAPVDLWLNVIMLDNHIQLPVHRIA